MNYCMIRSSIKRVFVWYTSLTHNINASDPIHPFLFIFTQLISSFIHSQDPQKEFSRDRPLCQWEGQDTGVCLLRSVRQTACTSEREVCDAGGVCMLCQEVYLLPPEQSVLTLIGLCMPLTSSDWDDVGSASVITASTTPFFFSLSL